jgi:hypothetical protein
MGTSSRESSCRLRGQLPGVGERNLEASERATSVDALQAVAPSGVCLSIRDVVWPDDQNLESMAKHPSL